MLPVVRIYNHNMRFTAHPFIYCRSLLNTSKVINGELNPKNVVAIQSKASLKKKKLLEIITSNIIWLYRLIINFIKMKYLRLSYLII